ncbi:helix-turn-helix domain-containing protein [Sphaerotilus mobilis]|uniref:AraC family ethanolamine operon transcriptional activator n=1 Tax=Sphaerotilus mobilis TaxID=47994 RepID=A0A4Q7LB46_9BURK|nr:helix-turn-helix domain-containing protein [Sphaerotilus mobilis]RZS46870.1 AraC family ethanolamine operon transcriptional activator [Sphaerotilus mobilis]
MTPSHAPNPPAAAVAFGVRVARTGDVDEQAALLDGWNQGYAQLSAGRFDGQIEEAWLDGVHLFVESTSRRLMQRGALAPDRVAIGLPLQRGQGPAVFCGVSDWGQGEAARYCGFSGSEGFEFYTPEGLAMAGLELSRDELLALATDDERERIERVAARAGLHLAAPGSVAGLRDFMQGAFGMLRTQPGLLDQAALRGQLRQSALSNALEALVHGADEADEPAPQRAWQLVEGARALVQQEAESPLTVAQLCLTLGVSRRTLQSAFQQVLGMAPAAFLRAVRLAGARRALRGAATVTEAAAQWGFWHFSHFAQDFRRMYGELPSQAWRRMRQLRH